MPRVYLVVDQKDSLSISVRVCHTLCSLRGSVGVFFLRRPVSILPPLSLEVKEISAKSWGKVDGVITVSKIPAPPKEYVQKPRQTQPTIGAIFNMQGPDGPGLGLELD